MTNDCWAEHLCCCFIQYVSRHAGLGPRPQHQHQRKARSSLSPAQVKGQTQSFMAHIRLGVEQAAVDPSSVLLFSGGKTRASAGPRAEAEGYWLVAEANDWFGHPEVRRRAFTEVRIKRLGLHGLARFPRYVQFHGRPCAGRPWQYSVLSGQAGVISAPA